MREQPNYSYLPDLGWGFETLDALGKREAELEELLVYTPERTALHWTIANVILMVFSLRWNDHLDGWEADDVQLNEVVDRIYNEFVLPKIEIQREDFHESREGFLASATELVERFSQEGYQLPIDPVKQDLMEQQAYSIYQEIVRRATTRTSEPEPFYEEFLYEPGYFWSGATLQKVISQCIADNFTRDYYENATKEIVAQQMETARAANLSGIDWLDRQADKARVIGFVFGAPRTGKSSFAASLLGADPIWSKHKGNVAIISQDRYEAILVDESERAKSVYLFTAPFFDERRLVYAKVNSLVRGLSANSECPTVVFEIASFRKLGGSDIIQVVEKRRTIMFYALTSPVEVCLKRDVRSFQAESRERSPSLQTAVNYYNQVSEQTVDVLTDSANRGANVPFRIINTAGFGNGRWFDIATGNLNERRMIVHDIAATVDFLRKFRLLDPAKLKDAILSRFEPEGLFEEDKLASKQSISRNMHKLAHAMVIEFADEGIVYGVSTPSPGGDGARIEVRDRERFAAITKKSPEVAAAMRAIDSSVPLLTETNKNLGHKPALSPDEPLPSPPQRSRKRNVRRKN